MQNALKGALIILIIFFGVLGLAKSSSARTYTTNFSLTENPISESGNWTNGKTNGLDWNNVRTDGTHAHGTMNGSVMYADDTSLLTGTWAANQEAQGTVYTINQVDDYAQEVEIRLRSSITAHSNKGYEIFFHCSQTSNAYAAIVRWNGPLSDYTVLADLHGTQYGIKTGDVVKATIIGNVIKGYINGVEVVTATDSTYSTGNPGMGFFLVAAGAGTNTNFGFSKFTASDEIDTTAPSVPTNLIANTVSSSQINLSWTASTDNVGVTGYRVESCSGSSCTNFAQIGTPSGTTFSNTGLTASTTYRYRVRAADAAGNLSGYSSIANATTQAASQGPIAWWKLDETSGTTASDSSGNGNTGTLVNGPVWTTGKLGNALSFDGANDYVNLGNPNSALRFTGNGTISAWVRLNSTGTLGGTIFEKQSDSNTGKYWQWGMVFSVGSSGKLYLSIVHTDGVAHQHDLTGSGVIGTGAWHHVVGVWESPYLKVYIDGALDSSLNIGSGTLRTGTSGASYIGAIYGQSDTIQTLFNGAIDDARIYSRALNASEIADLYNSYQSTPQCGDSSCNGAETCSTCPDDCPAGSGQVCCSGTLYTGNCCTDSDCTSPQICSNHACTQPTESQISVDSTFSGYSSAVIHDGVINETGGKSTTWASSANSTQPHWIAVNFSTQTQINYVNIWWAYNSVQSMLMTSQRVDVQYWNGSDYQTTTSILRPGTDVANSSASFPAVTTSSLRFYQPANMGPLTYSTVLWITELDYGFCHKSNSDCNSCVSDTELFAFIDQWKVDSSNPTLKELIEAIGLWKREC